MLFEDLYKHFMFKYPIFQLAEHDTVTSDISMGNILYPPPL